MNISILGFAVAYFLVEGTLSCFDHLVVVGTGTVGARIECREFHDGRSEGAVRAKDEHGVWVALWNEHQVRAFVARVCVHDM